nr:hypothetical protein [Microbacterium atlanticum]
MSEPSRPASAPSRPPQNWSPPGTAPFGPPSAAAYAPPPGYAPPTGFGVAPSGAAPFSPAGAAPPRRSGALGIVALVLAVVAAVGASLLAAAAAFNIGLGAGREISGRPVTADFDWSILTPVRDWVLLGEIAFWAGTVLGLWALIQGTVAMVTSRGRGAGIAAVIVAALGPVAFGVTVQALLGAGLTAGSGIGG